MIGVVGGGQLARMLVQAATQCEVPIAVQTSNAEDPAAGLASRLVAADPRDVAGTRELVVGCDGVTFENEWVNIDALLPLEQQGVDIHPLVFKGDAITTHHQITGPSHIPGISRNNTGCQTSSRITLIGGLHGDRHLSLRGGLNKHPCQLTTSHNTDHRVRAVFRSLPLCRSDDTVKSADDRLQRPDESS